MRIILAINELASAYLVAFNKNSKFLIPISCTFTLSILSNTAFPSIADLIPILALIVPNKDANLVKQFIKAYIKVQIQF